MAVTSKITVGGIHILEVDADPTVSAPVPAPPDGSLALYSGGTYSYTGASWGSVGGGGGSGVARYATLTSSTGSVLGSAGTSYDIIAVVDNATFTFTAPLTPSSGDTVRLRVSGAATPDYPVTFDGNGTSIWFPNGSGNGPSVDISARGGDITFVYLNGTEGPSLISAGWYVLSENTDETSPQILHVSKNPAQQVAGMGFNSLTDALSHVASNVSSTYRSATVPYIIMVEPGTYNETAASPLTVPDGVHIQGLGAPGPEVYATGSDFQSYPIILGALQAVEGSTVQFSNLVIRSDGIGAPCFEQTAGTVGFRVRLPELPVGGQRARVRHR